MQVGDVVTEPEEVDVLRVLARLQRSCEPARDRADPLRFALEELRHARDVPPRLDEERAEIGALPALVDDAVGRAHEIVLVQDAARKLDLPAMLAADEAAGLAVARRCQALGWPPKQVM
jgi:hypothetical protein